MLHLLDHARELTDLIFEPAHSSHHFGIFAATLSEQLNQDDRRVRGHRGWMQRHRGRVAAETRQQGERGNGEQEHSITHDHHSDFAGTIAQTGTNWPPQDSGLSASKVWLGPKCKWRPEPGAIGDLRNCRYQAPVFNTVTTRRFCDQHEMSLQIATGRSLP